MTVIQPLRTTGGNPSHKSSRQPIACDPCRASKRKCSGGQPCGSCERRRLKGQVVCRYDFASELKMAARLDSRKIKSLKRRRKGSHEDPSAVCSDGTTLVLDSMSETSCSSSLHQEQRSTMLSSRADADRLTSQQQLTHDRRTNGCRSPPLTSQVMATPAQSIYNLRSTSRMPQSKIFAYGPCQSDDHSSNGHREVVDFHVQDRNAKMSTMIITRERLLKPSPRHGRRSYNGSIASPIGGTPWSHRSSDSALGPSFLALESLQVSFERPSMLQPAAISHINEKRCHSQCGDEDDVEDDDDDDDDTNSYMETSSSPSPLMHHQRFNSMPVGIATATDQTGSLAHQVCARTAPHLCHSTATVEREILFSSFSNCVPRCSVKRTLPKLSSLRLPVHRADPSSSSDSLRAHHIVKKSGAKGRQI